MVHGEGLAAGRRRRVGLGAVEVELALGRRRVGRRREAGVLLDQVRELVAGLGRIEQVGGDGRVELQAAQVDAEGRAASASADLTSWPRTGGRLQRLDDAGVGEVVAGDPRHGGRPGVGDDGQAS